MVNKSIILVGIQFACLFYFALNSSLPQTWYLLLADLLGIGLGLWALITMRRGKFSVFPEPKLNSSLITSGPYQFIRHPMYTSILLVCASIVLSNPSMLNAILLMVLLVNQLVKLHHEEGLLLAEFPEYANYKKQSKKLIPYVY